MAGGLLADAVPFDVAFRWISRPIWAAYPAIARAFGRYISSLTEQIAQEILVTYDFSAYQRLVDVGGGIGTLAAAITTRYPQCRAMVLDQAAMQPEAERFLAAQGVTERCSFVAGDFYGAIPAGDLLVLCQVLHDLSDVQCQQVLHRCYESLAPNGCLLVLEMLADSEAPVLPVVAKSQDGRDVERFGTLTRRVVGTLTRRWIFRHTGLTADGVGVYRGSPANMYGIEGMSS